MNAVLDKKRPSGGMAKPLPLTPVLVLVGIPIAAAYLALRPPYDGMFLSCASVLVLGGAALLQGKHRLAVVLLAFLASSTLTTLWLIRLG